MCVYIYIYNPRPFPFWRLGVAQEVGGVREVVLEVGDALQSALRASPDDYIIRRRIVVIITTVTVIIKILIIVRRASPRERPLFA